MGSLFHSVMRNLVPALTSMTNISHEHRNPVRDSVRAMDFLGHIKLRGRQKEREILHYAVCLMSVGSQHGIMSVIDPSTDLPTAVLHTVRRHVFRDANQFPGYQ